MQTDDDSYVRVGALLKKVRAVGRAATFLGNIEAAGGHPIRDPKNQWCVRPQTPKPHTFGMSVFGSEGRYIVVPQHRFKSQLLCFETFTFTLIFYIIILLFQAILAITDVANAGGDGSC